MNIKTEIKSFPYLETAVTVAHELGVSAFVVGGFVRDIILKREIDDVDIVVIGNGIEFANTLAEKFNVNDVTIFKNFGTAHFFYNNIDFEVVGARKESYKRDSRKPDVETGSFKDDLLRRDFTINTMAVSL
ncbi:MAG: hypothetical protein R3321_15500, partial [Nitrososphaeraceae archaeon]|nr:hypothetical protein [Nitrososphaeraceae archaeon]